MSTALNLIAESAVERAPTREFAEAMSALASGVVLITCRVGDRPWGMTVTAFASVSADPPTVLASLGAEARSALAIKATRRFGISILADDQMAVARYGARPGAAKFLERFVDSRGGGSPVIVGALAHLDCELGETVEAGDHTVLFGCVRAARTFHKGAPLVYHHRAFRTVTDPTTGRNVRCLSS